MAIPNTMSGVYLTGHGGPEVLEWREDIPVPKPGPGQVLVRVAAAGVNNTDINTRVGWYSSDVTGATDTVEQDVEAGGWGGALHFPRIQGGDLCGIVEMVGEGVHFSPGQRVTCPINLPRPRPGHPRGFVALGSEIDGAFAQYCLVEADDLYDVSTSPLSDVEIAAIPCAFGTAENLLTRAGVTAGQKVLITGASGGVGLAAVQLASLRGATVWGVTGAAKAKVVMSQGARATFDRSEPLPQDIFDVVIDVVGGPAWASLILALKPGGHYAVSGAIAGPIVQADLRDIYLRDITIHGCTHQSPEVFGRLVELMNSGRIKPLISCTYPLKDIAQAQADFQSKTLPGKLVLLPQGAIA
ncbi:MULTISPECIES: alcohol dehydrogenase family protein [unclassified Ruegeria]|uniref:alcohol dehydrogenase family protein n=1 Tax=unclassified Ruegeria TaxID=2625375 RepID=UPI001487BF27|nr:MULTISPECIES: alcohol dehydrogenase family protein [unclassified Ruegeria]NOD49159.1 zinc-binding dehydrogenase [Ruegeria sp. HKCCD5849]NOD51723.1 zinc-binding dehydrogenase [Ruegeria sp. HKCCD5851]NOD68709.1 zinc-binding dehydrogenase [Ruegeria sp. HKCCD7303]NOE34984.1 zinc-binding dehydrogenase [Ruegeria sp. HKCCD7318]